MNLYVMTTNDIINLQCHFDMVSKICLRTNHWYTKSFSLDKYWKGRPTVQQCVFKWTYYRTYSIPKGSFRFNEFTFFIKWLNKIIRKNKEYFDFNDELMQTVIASFYVDNFPG